MRFKQVAMVFITVLFATAAFSGDKVHEKIEIRVVSDDSGGESVVVLDSETLGFNMHDMQVGENRSVVDKNGRAVLITRQEKGFTLDVDGKTIELPVVRGHHEQKIRAHGAHDTDVDIRVVKAHADGEPMAMDGVLIFSGKEIDAATQDIIRTALESAGHSEVRFADGKDGGPAQVHVIREVHEVREISE
jgi:hypothetical protein